MLFLVKLYCPPKQDILTFRFIITLLGKRTSNPEAFATCGKGFQWLMFILCLLLVVHLIWAGLMKYIASPVTTTVSSFPLTQEHMPMITLQFKETGSNLFKGGSQGIDVTGLNKKYSDSDGDIGDIEKEWLKLLEDATK